MDTFVTTNLKRALKLMVALNLLFLFTSCPGHEDCNDLDSITRVNDLITLLPEQTIYNQGDLVTLSLSIPSINNYFGYEVDLYANTNDSQARLVMSSVELFTNNALTFVKGSQGEYDNWLNIPYNAETDTYELEVIIRLNRTGSYSVITDDSVQFIGGDCNRYRLDTNILWASDVIVEFTVNE